MIGHSSSPVVTPTIAVDLDGVLYNWAATARYLLKAEWGYELNDSPHWDYIQENVSKEAWRWLWNGGIKRGLFRHGHVIKGGVDGVMALKEAGCRLYVATARPESARRDTQQWVRFHFPEVFDDVFILNEDQPKRIVPAHILIDDRPENINDWTASGRWSIVFDQAWNQQATWNQPELVNRAKGWVDIPRIVNDITEGDA